MKKETFLFYADWLNVIRDLPSEVQLEVYQAIAEYAIYGNLIELKPLAKVAFGFVKQTIDRDTQKYISISEKRSEAGKKGGRRLKDNELEESNEKQKKQLLSEKSKKSNCSLNDNDNVNDNDISFLEKKKQKSDVAVSDLENENSESPIETLQTPKEQSGGGRKRFTIPTPEEVQAYCDERKNDISGQQFCDFYSSKGWKVGSQPMKDWKAAVRTWEMRRKDQSPSITQPQPQISTPKRIRFDEYGNEVVY
jgi:hypothetical protein|nr:MAG TPA: hypothetical protein [Caudoviricetes sp.]